MTSKSMRSFAGGLVVAAGLCGAVYFFGPGEATGTSEKLSEDEMKESLASEGYVIHSEKEWEDQIAEAQSVKDKAEAEKETVKEPTEKVIYRTVLTVSKGSTSIDVGKTLQKAKVIKNANEFSDAVEKKGKANGLRPGTYVVDSAMTTEKIISIIFK
ncbi:endolytic transglycosylase MltG [Peribacillus castrilensis]|uniref:Aminodeoxychorismate lyase n=1 Tax=Peribacillus simplex TaxID=1478 RepID=A0AAN2PBJ2_9BACI|nr:MULTISPECIES: endolytic transglycosylase MltG [Bacillaceae]MCD1160032.1 endolytic transglycosylase MltG [Peribacillus castrilensis]MCP1094403.1 endolytic transglycosylase MltG [Bacillaceae bacterium OS4b]MBD8587931.1 endolytic transglycosylase MltG [Peribacillus simplex]MCF7623200.1 endolytic transglycosylase MltG [Peribacillus frigoritolerans]MCP1153752.1 endolytic transglycosylase MltG [Peribacillus frigoritolerans]